MPRHQIDYQIDWNSYHVEEYIGEGVPVDWIAHHVGEYIADDVPVVLLHGFTGDTTTWNTVSHALKSDFSIIAIDILGHGKTNKSPYVEDYQMENVASQILSLIDICADGKVHLLGYSMGGRLALYLAVHFPERFHSLILESASPGLATQQERDERRDRDNALADKIEANGIAWFVDFWENLSLWESQKSLSQDVLQSQREQRLRNDPLGLANSLRGMGTGVQPSVWGALPKLTLPTLLLVGEHDHKFVMINELMAQAIPSAMLVTIPNAGHTAHLENPTAFIAQVRQFLDTVS